MRRETFAVLAMLALSGCPTPVGLDDGGTGGGGGGTATGGGGGTEIIDAGFARSARGNLRFKGNERLTYDLGIALGLPLDQLCLELGQYPCTYVVHTVALGGVDPYGKGLFEGAHVTGATTPIVVERVALAACSKRVTQDLATPASAVVFKSIPVSGGKLTAPNGPEVRLALSELAQRAWLRDPTEAELQHLIGLNAGIEALNVPDPAQAFMKAACFTVFTSAESVFY